MQLAFNLNICLLINVSINKTFAKYCSIYTFDIKI